MITGRLLMVGQGAPLWAAVSLLEFGVALMYLRGLPWRSEDARAWAAETACAAAAWCAAGLMHLDFLLDFGLKAALLAAYCALSRAANARQAVYYSCAFQMFTEMAKVVCVDLVLQPLDGLTGWLAALSPLALTAVYGASYLLLALGVSEGLRRWVFVPGVERLSWRQLLLVVLPLVPYLYIRSSYFLEGVPSNPSFYWNFVLMMLILSGCTVAMLVGNASNFSSQLERTELVRMEMLLKEQGAQYLAQKKADEAVRRRYHDLKHYLAEFEVLLKDGAAGPGADAEALLADMRRELGSYEARIETGNEAADVVLAEKMAACEQAGARPVFYADAACLSFMSAFDLCAVLGNLLDNAVEAVAGLARRSEEGEAGVPEVVLDIRPRKGFASIRCSNPYVGGLRPVEGGYATTKRDREGHGVGLRSVRETVERYGGVLTLEAAGGVFTATAIVPLPDASQAEGRGGAQASGPERSLR